MEYLVTMTSGRSGPSEVDAVRAREAARTVQVPAGTSGNALAQAEAGEARRTAELAASGSLVRLWRVPGQDRNLGHWQTADAGELAAELDSLPMVAWLGVETIALAPHPSDRERPLPPRDGVGALLRCCSERDAGREPLGGVQEVEAPRELPDDPQAGAEPGAGAR